MPSVKLLDYSHSVINAPYIAMDFYLLSDIIYYDDKNIDDSNNTSVSDNSFIFVAKLNSSKTHHKNKTK